VRVVAPRDGRVQTLIGGRGTSTPLTDGPLRLFEPKKENKKGPTQKTATSSSSLSSSSNIEKRAEERNGSAEGVLLGKKAANDKDASNKVKVHCDEGSTNSKPLWKKGDVLEGVAWQRGGGRWQRAVVVEAWGAAFGEESPRQAHVGNGTAAGGARASQSGSADKDAATSPLTAQALPPLNPAVIMLVIESRAYVKQFL